MGLIDGLMDMEEKCSSHCPFEVYAVLTVLSLVCRQERLLNGWYFHCTCIRCQDPLGKLTVLSACTK